MAHMIARARHGFPDLVHGNFGYKFNGRPYVNRSGQRVRYVKCAVEFCNVTGKQINGFIEIVDGVHNHAANPIAREVQHAEDNLYQMATKSFEKNTIIFERIEQLYPNAAAYWNYPLIRDRIRRWRTSAEYPVINTLEQAHDMLSSIEYQSYRRLLDNYFNVELLNAGQPSETLIYYHPRAVDQLKDSTEIYLHSSGSNLPTNVQVNELLTIMVVKQRRAHPVIWCFISNKSLDAYMGVAAKVKDLFEQAISVNTTWDTEMQEAFRRNFAEVRGTFYSYTKTICDKFIEAEIDEDDENIIIISKLVSLAFLPPVEMNRHFYEIVERMAYDDRVIFWPLLIYVHSVWIQSVGAGLSVDVNGIGTNFIDVQQNLSRLYYNSFQRIENITLMDHLKIITKATDCVLGYIDVDRFRPPSEWSLLMASNIHLPTIHRIYESVQRHDISWLEALRSFSFQLDMYIRNILVFNDPNPIGYRIVDEIYGPRLMNRDEIIYIDDDELLQQENFNVRRPRGNPARRGIQNDVVPNNNNADVENQLNVGANNVLQGDAGDRGPDDDEDIIQEAPIIDNNNNANVENQLNAIHDPNHIAAVIRQGPFIDNNNADVENQLNVGANNVLQGDAGDRGPDDDEDIIQEAPIIDNNNNANVENQLNVEAGANNVHGDHEPDHDVEIVHEAPIINNDNNAAIGIRLNVGVDAGIGHNRVNNAGNNNIVLDDASTCKICYQHRFNIVLLPCRHLLCQYCLEHLNELICPFCRQNIAQTIGMIFP